ncbi:TetR/AcrR family transcriptional regulator [Aquibacillus koreensis]|uniref:TetR/AcrR family transcriptional regulator n=1 Tax=Aquibacillus koreensis TaxID=279446 RepID=A0A9X4AIT0_9BACI|nr:TetR-like C-terminal domain-containing protein [Aquibacillus koreensis]MCT2534680.1 TetR/AcrR family transcriptional regulator [Aquibacillus koreensis]MDC3419710.1 TetR/AcrR family transcriptional regulator [Aquibacillus koreensis]
MENKKQTTDPRVIRTRQLLREALISLLQEIDIDKISVNRLAQRATINRVTFYLHYRDIPDMLEKMAGEMIEEMSTVLRQSSSNRVRPYTEDDYCAIMEDLLKHIATNSTFYKTILASKRIPVFYDQLQTFLTDKIVSSVEKKEKVHIVDHRDRIQKDILIWYDSAALIGTITSWLRRDMPYTPAYLAKQFYTIRNR